MDIYSILRFYNLSIHPVKSNKEKVLSNKEIFLKKYLLVFKA
jgi:hypothetical protein